MLTNEQVEELDAIESIYDGDADVVLKREASIEDTLSGISISMHLRAESPITVFREGSPGARPAIVGALPLELRVTCPPAYLAQPDDVDAADVQDRMPMLEIRAPWLGGDAAVLLHELMKQAAALVPEQTLFPWIEWCRSDALRFLNVVDAVIVPSTCSDEDYEELLTWAAHLEVQDFEETTHLCACCKEQHAGSNSINLPTCGHTLCQQCHWLVMDLHSKAEAVPRCPAADCGAALPTSKCMGCTGLPTSVAAQRILNSTLKSSVVFCPRCEDLGLDSPILVGDRSWKVEESGGADPCQCHACEWTFCAACRSPWHPGQACCDSPHRVKRLLNRRPPLPGLDREGLPSRIEQQKSLIHLTEAMLEQRWKEAQLAQGKKVKSKTSSEDDDGHEVKVNVVNGAKWLVDKRIALQQRDGEQPTAFQYIQEWMWARHGHEILSSLSGVFSDGGSLDPAPMNPALQERFVSQVLKKPDVEVLPAFHGTDAANHTSIFKNGLLVPGVGNSLSVAHGQAHGRGIYVAGVGAAWLSALFCTRPKMLVCAVLDTRDVYHVGDAMVVPQETLVIPIFEAQGRYASPWARSQIPRVLAYNAQAGDKNDDTSSCSASISKQSKKTSRFTARFASRANKYN